MQQLWKKTEWHSYSFHNKIYLRWSLNIFNHNTYCFMVRIVGIVCQMGRSAKWAGLPNGHVGQMGRSAKWAGRPNGPVGRMARIGWSPELAGWPNGPVGREGRLAEWAVRQNGLVGQMGWLLYLLGPPTTRWMTMRLRWKQTITIPASQLRCRR